MEKVLSGSYSLKEEIKLEGDPEGDPEGLLEVAFLVEGGLGNSCDLPLTPSQESPLPYDAFLNRLEIRISGDRKVSIKRMKDTLQISGSKYKMKIIAKNIRHLVKQAQEEPQAGVRHHSHVEYWPDHPILDSESESLVVGVVKDRSANFLDS